MDIFFRGICNAMRTNTVDMFYISSSSSTCKQNDKDCRNTLAANDIPQITIQTSRDSNYDDLDPITLEKLSQNTFTFKAEDKSSGITYNVDSLISFFLSTGELRDPVSRIEYSDKHIVELNERAMAQNLPIIPLTARSESTRNSFKSQYQFTSGLEAVLGEIVAEILTLIESPRLTMHAFNSQFAILTSEFLQPFLELKEIDLESAYLALLSWKSFLKGSPKKPTFSANGRLQVALQFFDSLWNEDDHKGIVQLRRQPDVTETVLSETSSAACPTQVMFKKQSQDVLTDHADTNESTSLAHVIQTALTP